ncbi:FAD-dependent oxidoreductase [Rhodococcus hoagii]|nr:FAD-dependent oxidoreductase [Prescottella equi]
MVWVSGRAPHELDASLRSRELWADLARRVPEIGFRAAGSITLLRTPEEVAVAEDMVARDDAEVRGFTLLDPENVRGVNPALRGQVPRRPPLNPRRRGRVQGRAAAIRRHLEASGRYAFHAGTEAREITSSSTGVRIRDDHDRTFDADLVIVCPAPRSAGSPGPGRRPAPPTRPPADDADRTAGRGAHHRHRRRRQHALLPRLHRLGAGRTARRAAQEPTAAEHRMQLLCVQRLHGGLTSATPTSTTSRSTSTSTRRRTAI